jgi:tetratricopeptide (TPR) repeat protein
VAFLTLPSALVFYLRHLVFPVSLSPSYDLRYTEKLLSARFILTFGISLATAAFLWLFPRRNSAERTAIGWMFLPLLPPLASIAEFATGDIVHDRYLYLSSMGFAMLVAAFAIRAKNNVREWRIEILPVAAAGVFAVLLTAQLGYWKDNLTLFQRGAQESPRSILALDLLANERFKEKDFAGALDAYQRSLAVDPNSWRTNLALAITLSAMNEDGQSVRYYRQAIDIDPKHIQQYILLAQAQEHEHLYADAEETVNRGLLVADNLAELYLELGSLLERRGDLAGAQQQYQRAQGIDPQRRNTSSHADTPGITDAVP